MIVKTEFPPPSQLLVMVMLGGTRVGVGVRVMVGVGVTQSAVVKAIWDALGVVPSLIPTEIFPYSPLIVSCWVSPVVPAAASIKTPLVRKTLF